MSYLIKILATCRLVTIGYVVEQIVKKYTMMFVSASIDVSICEEEIRKLKKQLTLAVRMFRKRGENIVMEMQ